LLQKDSKPCKPKQCNLLCGSLLFQIESPFPIAQRKIQEPIARLSTRSSIAHHQASLQKTDRASSDSRGDRRSLFGCSIGQIGCWRYYRLDFLAQVRSLNYDGGCHPAEIQNDRAITKLSLFNCNATTVTRPMLYNTTAELEYLDRVWPINRDILLQYQQEQKNDGSIQITSSKIANGDYRRLVV
jgi:hypothetical protein